MLAKYKDLRKEVTTLVKNSKIEHYQNLFSENSNDLRTTWRGIKSIININSRETISSTALKINDKISNEPSEVANEFNTYYENVAKDLQDKIHTVNQNFEMYLAESTKEAFSSLQLIHSKYSTQLTLTSATKVLVQIAYRTVFLI